MKNINSQKLNIEYVEKLEKENELLKMQLVNSYSTGNLLVEQEKMKNRILMRKLVIANEQLKNIQRLCNFNG